MSDYFSLVLFTAALWGDRPGQVPLCLEEHPPFGEISPDQKRYVRSPVQIRLDAAGGLHLLPDAALRGDRSVPVLHFDASGHATGSTPLPAEDRATLELSIADYAIDAEGSCYLLEQIRPRSGRPENRLRKLSGGGEVLWSRTGSVMGESFDLQTLVGTYRRLLLDGSRLFLPVTEPTGALGEIDPTTGRTARIIAFEPGGGETFAASAGTALYTLYFQYLNRRGIGALDLSSGKVETRVGDDFLFGWLVYPFGADAALNLYVWRDSAIARVSFAGELQPVAALDNLVVRPDAVYASHLPPDRPPTVRVSRYPAAGEPERIDVALPHTLGEIRDWRLVHAESERFFLFGGERPGQAGTLLVASREGRLEEVSHPPGDLFALESAMEKFPFWQVDSRGRIYLPVTDPEGVKVVRLQPGPAIPTDQATPATE